MNNFRKVIYITFAILVIVPLIVGIIVNKREGQKEEKNKGAESKVDYYKEALSLFANNNECGFSEDKIFEDISRATFTKEEIKNTDLYEAYKSDLRFREILGDLDPRTWNGLEEVLAESSFLGPQPGASPAYILSFKRDGKLEYLSPLSLGGDGFDKPEIWSWKIISKKPGESAKISLTDKKGINTVLELSKVFININDKKGYYFLLNEEDKTHIKDNNFQGYFSPSHSNTNLDKCSA
ncbi:MAG: hypothetical protein NTV72_02420 [Candidatus Taylorbacteria bacterium]|nr:hypothetical protein [Candidatus Taylorbacteria bacterium]